MLVVLPVKRTLEAQIFAAVSCSFISGVRLNRDSKAEGERDFSSGFTSPSLYLSVPSTRLVP